MQLFESLSGQKKLLEFNPRFPNPSPYCSMCGEFFGSVLVMDRHRELEHPQALPGKRDHELFCSFCGGRFPSPAAVRIHKIHGCLS